MRFWLGKVVAAVISLDTKVLTSHFSDEASAHNATVKQQETTNSLTQSGQALLISKLVHASNSGLATRDGATSA